MQFQTLTNCCSTCHLNDMGSWYDSALWNRFNGRCTSLRREGIGAVIYMTRYGWVDRWKLRLAHGFRQVGSYRNRSGSKVYVMLKTL